MDASLIARLKELEDENRRLKKMYAEERLKAEVAQEALQKRGEAILLTRDGATNRRERHQHPAGLPGIWHQPDRLPLLGKAVSRECRDRRPPAPFDPQSAQLGIWAVLSVPAQREGLPMESQTGVSHLSRTRTEPANQAEKADCSGEARAFGCACSHQPMLVDGFHARPAFGWSQLLIAQRHRRFQPGGPGHRH